MASVERSKSGMVVESGTLSVGAGGKRALRMPADASDYARDIFKLVLKLTTVRDPELEELRLNYEGRHEIMVDAYLQKPPPWDDETWAYVKKDLMHINSTRTTLRTLSSGVYGGVPSRKIVAEEKAPFGKQLNEHIVSPAWRASMKRLLREMALYGTGYIVPEYDRESRRFKHRHLNPVTTHIISTEMDPEVPIAVAEFDTRRNWVRIWAPEFYAVLARLEGDVEWLEYIAPAEGGDSSAGATVITKPFFPVLIAKAEDIPGSPYGPSLLRDTPRFNRALAVSYFNVSFTAKLKAQALLTVVSGDSSDEVNADLTQLGVHSALILPKGAAADFISNQADVQSLMDVIDRLQDLESYVLGIPAIRAEKNLSAEGARLAAAPLTSQVGELSTVMSQVEVTGMQLLALTGHFEVGSYATVEDVERMYKISVRINPIINIESLRERTDSMLQQAEKGATPEIECVSQLNPWMSYDEAKAQAEIMRERVGSKEDPELTFKRKVISDFIADGTVSDVIANSTDIGKLVQDSGLPRFDEYKEPWLPVTADNGAMVSGEVLKDAEGDIVGGAVVDGPEEKQKPSTQEEDKSVDA